MEDIEPYCDSEEEVFFGPVTKKERLKYEALELKEALNANAEEITTRYVGGDEGLHALAEAASMLSISSWEVEKVKEVKVNKGIMGEEEVNFSKKLPSLCVKENAGMMNGSKGITMELDAVKFLTEHVPEHNGKYEVGNHQVECMKEMYQSSDGIPHHNSLASSVDNHLCSFNHTVSADSPIDSFLVLEAQCKIEDSLEKKPEKLIPNFELEQLPPLNLSSTELQNMNDESVFEMKLSDNEEEIEKVERNLKVEEIIKFLADEDTKTESEEKKETCVENADQDKSHQMDPQNGKLNKDDDDDVIIIEINDNEIVDLTDCPSHVTEKFPRSKENDFKCELNNSDPASLDIKMKVGLKEEAVDVTVPTIDMEKEMQLVNACGLYGKGVKVEDEHDKLISASFVERDSKQICSEIVKIPGNFLEEGDIQEVSNLQMMKQHLKASSLNSKNGSVTRTNMKTPSKVLLRPVHGTGTLNLHKQPLFGDSKRHPATSGPLVPPLPARNIFSSSRIPLKSTSGKNFKTPNSKTNTMVTSKIPHALHPVTPSPRKNKYADVMSPVAQYIHGKPTLLVMNKNVPSVKSTLKEPFRSKSGASEQANMDRGAENIDVNNILSAPLPSNINYRSAVPVKIFSPSPSKCQGNGPVGSVSKHIGRIKITSLKTGKVEMPLGMQCRDSLIPDGEVSVLLTKEMSAAEDISTS